MTNRGVEMEPGMRYKFRPDHVMDEKSWWCGCTLKIIIFVSCPELFSVALMFKSNCSGIANFQHEHCAISSAVY